jgi:hypothetical protein
MNIEKIGPGHYAAGTVLAVPFCAVAIIGMALLMLAMWPIWPFMAYWQREKELAEEEAKTK